MRDVLLRTLVCAIAVAGGLSLGFAARQEGGIIIQKVSGATTTTLLAPAWSTSFENTTCANETGYPSSGTPSGTANCDFADPNGWSVYEGAHVLQATNAETFQILNVVSDPNQVWVRWWYLWEVTPTNDSEIMYEQTTSMFRVDHDSGDDFRVLCPAFQSSSYLNETMSAETWYINQAHWVAPTDPNDAGSGSGTLNIYTTAATPVEVGSGVSCTTNDASGVTFDDFMLRSKSGTNGELYWDCVEIYTSNPGAPSTNACHPNTQGQ